MKHPSKLFLTTVVALGLVSGILHAESQPTTRRADEHVASVWVGNAGEHLIVLTSNEAPRSRVRLTSAEGSTVEIPLSDMGVNRLKVVRSSETLDEPVLFVSGSTRSGYQSRLIQRQDRAWDTLWDSGHVDSYDETGLMVSSPEGRLWGHSRELEGGILRIEVGRFPDVTPFWTADLGSSVLTGSEAGGITDDFPNLALLSDFADDLLVAVAWKGSVRILGAGSPPLKAILEPSSPPMNLTFQPGTRTLWVGWGGGFDGFIVPRDLGSVEEPRSLTAEHRLNRDTEGFAPSNLFPLTDGGIALAGGRAGAAHVSIRPRPNLPEAPGLRNLDDLDYDAFEVSPDGRVIAALPQGDHSQVLHLHRRHQ